MDLKIGNPMEHTTMTVRLQLTGYMRLRIWLGVKLIKATMWMATRVLGCKLEMMEANNDRGDQVQDAEGPS